MPWSSSKLRGRHRVKARYPQRVSTLLDIQPVCGLHLAITVIPCSGTNIVIDNDDTPTTTTNNSSNKQRLLPNTTTTATVVLTAIRATARAAAATDSERFSTSHFAKEPAKCRRLWWSGTRFWRPRSPFLLPVSDLLWPFGHKKIVFMFANSVILFHSS